MYIEQEDILKHISAKPFHLISEAADELGVEAYVIGGYVGRRRHFQEKLS